MANMFLLLAIGLAAMKITAYLVEATWFVVKGYRLREEYMKQPIRSYALDHAIGRPRLFSAGAERSNAILFKAWQLLFKTPIVVVVLYVTVAITARWASRAPLIAAAVISSALAVCTLASPVVVRLILGPYDLLNPDLELFGGLRTRIYGSRTTAGLYILVLIGVTILGFASAYDATAVLTAAPGDIGEAADPVRWLFSAITVSSTAGFGDIKADTDGIRIILGMQMGLGPIALAWIASSFFGEKLPDHIERMLESRGS